MNYLKKNRTVCCARKDAEEENHIYSLSRTVLLPPHNNNIGRMLRRPFNRKSRTLPR
ncbi:Hypothetical protein, putative [Bodo saltans]|uniref:Uncharacterized protein n=1 Tax=Bodo saltans TaxID=75058 RepID=A0A0S4IS88_BODSA|nr:Hypothetical protein, putative [Bodo saltans]|eukprot:CUF63645.1 Hypothetical protein, putative [Bodo saltans]